MAINNGNPFRTCDASSVGLNRYQLREAHAAHVIRGVFTGAWVDSRTPDTRGLRIDALKLVAPPYAVASDITAAWVFDVHAGPPRERHLLVPKLVVPHSLTRLRHDRALCRQAKLPDSDVMEIDGLRLTTPTRTTADFLRRLWRPYAMSAADAMAHAALIDASEVAEYLKNLRGYRGIRQARNLVGLIEPKTESPGESWQRLRIVDAGFPAPEPQFEILDGNGIPRWFDLAYPELLIASEYDGREFHTTDHDREHDRTRRAYFEHRFGWRFSIGTRESIFGADPSFEVELGRMYGREPLLPRSW